MSVNEEPTGIESPGGVPHEVTALRVDIEIALRKIYGPETSSTIVEAVPQTNPKLLE